MQKEFMMSFVEALAVVSVEQRSALLGLEPVVFFNSIHVYDKPIDENAQTFLDGLEVVSGLTDEQRIRFIGVCAQELFDNGMTCYGYALLCHADIRYGGHSAVERAVEKSQMHMLHGRFLQGLDKQWWKLAFDKALESVEVELAHSYMLQLFKHSVSIDVAERMLNLWIARGDYTRATQVVSEYLSRQLSEEEKHEVARASLLRLSATADEEHLAFVKLYTSQSYRDAVVERVCRKAYCTWEQLCVFATQLGVVLTEIDVHAFLVRTDTAEKKLPAIEYLVKNSPTRMRREWLEQIRLEVRQEALNRSDIVNAERFGCEIGHPLTPVELLAFIRKWSWCREQASASSYVALIPWAKELLLARLQDPNASAPILPS